MKGVTNLNIGIWGLAAVLMFSACDRGGTKEERQEPADNHTLVADSSDTYLSEMPTKLDAVFDDFLLGYAGDSAMQWNRTRFPLPLQKKGKAEFVGMQDWKMTTLFGGEQCYTILFDTEKDIDLPTHTDLTDGLFEWIYPDRNMVSQYHFRRNDQGAWYLDSLCEASLENNPNAAFLKFYKKFATDIEYQKQHIDTPINFVTNFTDDNDGFTTDNFRIDMDQWLAWQVPMPAEKITNIVYGVRDNETTCAATRKILCIKAVDGTFFKALYFAKYKDNEWMLYKYEDTAY